MRAPVVVVVVALAGCRIPDEHFTVRGDGGGGGDDATDGAAPDAGTGSGFAYIVDQGGTGNVGAGVFTLTRNATGDLAVATAFPQPDPTTIIPSFAVTRGANLYLIGAQNGTPRIGRYVMGSDGALTSQESAMLLLNIVPTRAAIDPMGRWIVMPLQNSDVEIVALGPTGTVGAVTMSTVPGLAIKTVDVAFSHGGNCLFVASSSNTSNSLISSAFTGSIGSTNTIGAPGGLAAVVTHPTLEVVYAAGTSNLETYTLSSGCNFASQVTIGGGTTPPNGLVFDATGSHLFMTGSSVRVYDVNGAGVPSFVSTALDQAGGTTQNAGHGIVDPATNILYVTGPGYVSAGIVGAISAHLVAATLVQLSGAYPAACNQPRAIVLSP